MADPLVIALTVIGSLFVLYLLCCCGWCDCSPDTPRGSMVSTPNPRFNNQVNTEVVTSNENNGHVTQSAGDNTVERTEEFERTENL